MACRERLRASSRKARPLMTVMPNSTARQTAATKGTSSTMAAARATRRTATVYRVSSCGQAGGRAGGRASERGGVGGGGGLE